MFKSCSDESFHKALLDDCDDDLVQEQDYDLSKAYVNKSKYLRKLIDQNVWDVDLD